MALIDRRALRQGANVFGAIVLIALVVPFVVYAAPQVVGADESFVVLSGSMEPAMSPGDVVVVRGSPPGTVAAGDVITYRTESPTPTTHRVIEVVAQDGATAYVTKGDANEDPDSGVVAHERVIGTVMLTIPFLGHAINFVNTPVGFVVVVVAPLTLFVLGELRSLVGSVSGADEPVDADHEVDSPATPAGDEGFESAGRPDGQEATEEDGDAPPSAENAPPDEESTDGGASLTLTRSSLQIIALIFAVYLPYSAYVAYTVREAWAITMAVATMIGLLFVVGLHAGSRGSDDGPDASADETPDDGPDDSAADDSGPVVTPEPEVSRPGDGSERAVVDGGVNKIDGHDDSALTTGDGSASDTTREDLDTLAARDTGERDATEDWTAAELLEWQRHLGSAARDPPESEADPEAPSADEGRDA